MKAVIIIFILIASSSSLACDNSASTECDGVQYETYELLQAESNKCCSELCYCNCCNQLSVLSLILTQNVCENYSTPIVYHSIQNLSDYPSFHWQPPKV